MENKTNTKNTKNRTLFLEIVKYLSCDIKFTGFFIIRDIFIICRKLLLVQRGKENFMIIKQTIYVFMLYKIKIYNLNETYWILYSFTLFDEGNLQRL